MDSAAGVHAARIGGGLRIERDQWHRRNTPLDVQFNQSPGPFNCIGDRRWRTLFSASQPAPIARTHDLFGAMRDDMNRVLERFEGGWSRWPSLFTRGNGDMTIVPQLDVREDDKSITVEAELPGVAEKDLSVTLNNGVLRIKGEKKHERDEKKDNYYLAERSFGSFERLLRLPDTIDEAKLDTRFEQGVLKITAPKRAKAIKAEKKIEMRKA